jgi:hypothetical protein
MKMNLSCHLLWLKVQRVAELKPKFTSPRQNKTKESISVENFRMESVKEKRPFIQAKLWP